jgi:hypothetical protein
MRLRTALPPRLLARLYAIDHVTLWRHCKRVVETLSVLFETTPWRKATDRRHALDAGAMYRYYLVLGTQETACGEGASAVRRRRCRHSVSRVYPGSVHIVEVASDRREVSILIPHNHLLAVSHFDIVGVALDVVGRRGETQRVLKGGRVVVILDVSNAFY